jgi:hypothetical protein
VLDSRCPGHNIEDIVIHSGWDDCYFWVVTRGDVFARQQPREVAGWRRDNVCVVGITSQIIECIGGAIGKSRAE